MSDRFENSSDRESTVFRGPANWFTLTVPGALRLKQTDAFIEVHRRAQHTESVHTDRSEQWSMTLYTAWIDVDEPQTHPPVFNPSTLFPKVSRSQTEPPLSISGRCQTWSGRSVQARSDAWWSVLLRLKSTYEWRLWVIEHDRIMVVASLQSAAGCRLDRDTLELCESLLNSLQFSDLPAMPPELFRREVLQLAQKHFPLLQVRTSGSFNVQLGESEINLSNFYRSYLQDPARLKRIVLPGLTTVVRLQEWGPDQLMPPLSTVCDRIMPMLYPDQDAEQGLSEFVKVPWVGGLSVMFVIDEDDTYRFVHRRMLGTWQLTVEEVEEIAIRNLDRFADQHPLEVTAVGESGRTRMLVPLEPNAYNSVRLLGRQLHRRLREILGPELVIGVPNRDFFVAVSLEHPDLVRQVHQRVLQDYQSMHHPLTNRLLVISADGVSEYCEPPPSPAP
ncbi:MAG: DUF1444 family protein [Planctomycetaceae bacterium]